MSWKQCVKRESSTEPRQVSLLEARRFFAVDASGSTHGEVIRAEGDIVLGFHGNSEDTVTKWDMSCENPKLVTDIEYDDYWRDNQGTTYPDVILREPSALNAIRESDLWYLLTDGHIAPSRVNQLTQIAVYEKVLHIPVVIIIVGRYNSVRPEHANISVGLPFFASASDSIFLYKCATSGKLWVISAKGLFSPLANLSDNIHIAQWNDLAVYENERAFSEQCTMLGIRICKAQDRKVTSGISLGPQWEAVTGALVDVDLLLDQEQMESQDLYGLMEEETFVRLAIVCKTHDRLGALRALLLRHKQREVTTRLEDLNGAGKLLEEMQSGTYTSAQKERLRKKLREAHVANRMAYQRRKDFPSDEAKTATKTNGVLNQALSMLTGIEKAGYTADILNRKSNRAMRAKVVSDADSNTHLSAVELSDEVKAFRSTCSICCAENQIMSVVLKKLGTVEDNTTDFALNFPLAIGQALRNVDLVSSQCICFQCSLAVDRSVHREKPSARIPTVEYEGDNKSYINDQLTRAITAGLATGACGIIQIFMAVLDKTLQTKDWCAEKNAKDSEVMQRRQVMTWMLLNLLENCLTRKTFDETGPWVRYPEALAWAIENYRQAGLESWIIRYPLAGFWQLIRFFDMLDLPNETGTLMALQQSKLIHITATSLMKGNLCGKNSDRTWTYPFLELVYREFNAPCVPRDMKAASILGVDGFWAKLEVTLDPYFHGIKSFLDTFTVASRREVYNRIQVVIFWALYHQNGHTTAQTFFRTIGLNKKLAPAVLNPMTTLPDEEAEKMLRSIFVDARRNPIAHQSNEPPPFVTPFGASVLICGKKGCGVKFYDPEHSKSLEPEAIHNRRAEHLKETYGLGSRFAHSLHGLPENTITPKPPTSTHYNLHASISRVWSTLPLAANWNRDPLVLKNTTFSKLGKEPIWNGDEEAVTAFVTAVRMKICQEDGRGNIYQAGIEGEIRFLIPSFFEALRVAKRREMEDRKGGSEGENMRNKGEAKENVGLNYVHDWTKNTFRNKIAHELGLMEWKGEE